MTAADPLTAHLLTTDEAWMANACCARVPWLPWTESRPDPRDVFALQEVCADCPVIADCERFAIDAKITAGWWAGRSFNNYDVHHPPRRDPITHGGDAA